MYNALINLDSDEVIQFESSSTLVEYNEKCTSVAVIITNKRIMFLQDVNKNTVVDALNITGKFYTLPKYEPIEEILKVEIKDCKYIENGTEIVANDKNIFIFDHDLTDVLCD